MTDFSRDRLVSLLAYGDRISLRHDVDFDPQAALAMAELEHDHGVKSTFYVMARGPYNPFSIDSEQVIGHIFALGHSIGVHVELGLPRDAQPPGWLVEKWTTEQYRLLTSFYPHIVARKVSYHAPPLSMLWRTVPGFDHALSPRWDGLYLADSRGVWRQEPEAFIEQALARGERPQIGLHPCWWMWPQERADEQHAIEATKP